ncbi:MAG: HEAT repeat domain-containing protein, partial [Planctomycetota bacterium]
MWVLSMCAFAQAQSDADSLQRLVAGDAANLLRDPDPIVRGEAGLVVAALANPQYHSAILSLARDPEAQARERGIVALGLQATPGVTNLLDELLSDYQTRTQPAGIAAAFALGILPPEHAPGL